MGLMGLVGFYPTSCVDEGLNPRRHLIIAAVSGIPGVLPGEYGTLQVRHHAEMTTVSRADTGYVVVRTIRISGIASVVVLGNYVIRALCFWQREFSLSVSYPQTELVAAQ